jgi:hypothetical protein
MEVGAALVVFLNFSSAQGREDAEEVVFRFSPGIARPFSHWIND